ncbi:hypothetical protein M0802_015300 [Mischocyttarus mexicanus]|nr:hypothetical protein M0802_015300 [Mischocyttarus mexicanus]
MGRKAKVRRSFKYGLVKVASGFSQRKVKVKAKQSDRQGGQGSKNLLVQFSQGYLKDKKRLIPDESTTARVFLSKNFKRLRQGFFREKLRKVKDFFSTKFQKVVSGFSQQNVKVKSQQSDRQGGQGLKKLLV